MQSEKELQDVAIRVHWLYERGDMHECVRVLQSLQKEGMKYARDFSTPTGRAAIDRRMAELRS